MTPPSYGLPAGYIPFKQQPKEEPVEIPARIKQAAIDIHASHLSKDGKKAYQWRLGDLLQCDWDGFKFDSWWSCPELPMDAVKLP